MSEEDSIGWEWMKNRTPAEPVAKEPTMRDGLDYKSELEYVKELDRRDTATLAAQPTGEPNRAMTSYEWWLTRPDIDRIKLITRLHRESLGLAEPPSPAGARERAERAARAIHDLLGMFGLQSSPDVTISRKQFCLHVADIIERVWAGEGK